MFPVEYVAYVEESEISSYYPDSFDYLLSAPSDYGEMPLSFSGHTGVYMYANTGRRVSAAGITKQIYALRCVEFDNSPVSDSVTCYYYLTIHSIPVRYSFDVVPQEMLDIINSGSNPLEDPFADLVPGDLGYNQNTIFSWLYNLGSSLLQNNLVSSLLSFEVGGYNLISLLIQGGFMVYVGWVVTKWVIP